MLSMNTSLGVTIILILATTVVMPILSKKPIHLDILLLDVLFVLILLTIVAVSLGYGNLIKSFHNLFGTMRTKLQHVGAFAKNKVQAVAKTPNVVRKGMGIGAVGVATAFEQNPQQPEVTGLPHVNRNSYNRFSATAGLDKKVEKNQMWLNGVDDLAQAPPKSDPVPTLKSDNESGDDSPVPTLISDPPPEP